MSKGGDITNTYDPELYHFGIKGMKWGVRRFQNKNGTLTTAGKKRYADDEQPRVKNKSMHRQKLELKYRQNGMSKEEAEAAANKRIKAEKYIAAAAGITIASCAAYYAHKKYAVDRVISKDTEFQRIMKLNVGEQMAPGRQYLAYNKSDKTKYSGMLGLAFKEQRDKGWHNKDIQKVKIQYREDLKVASPKRARNTFEKMYKNNPEFRQAVEKGFKEMSVGLGSDKQNALFRRVNQGGKRSKLMLKTKGYDAFNIGLVNPSESGKKAANMFYNEMRKQGINAIVDINDKKYSGYNAKNPLIVFKGTYDYRGKVMDNKQIQSNLNKAVKDMIAKDTAKKGAKYVAGYGGAIVGGTYMTNKMYKRMVINDYKANHPNTKMSDAEILDTLYKKE